MTEHDDINNDINNDINDPVDAALRSAGKRLRDQSPDAVASRQALTRLHEQAGAPPRGRRSWWPALIGAGLAAAAVVGVIAIRSDDAETPTLTPATEPTSTSAPAPDTTVEPTTTLVPTTTGPGQSGASLIVDDGCITVTTAAGSATGCPNDSVELDHLDQRTFAADLDGPVLITSGSADPLVDLDATVDTGDFASRCRWDDLAPRIPDGGIVEVVVCNETGVMGMNTAPNTRILPTYSYFTLPTPYLPDGAELGPGTLIEGLPRALAFTAAVQDITTCSLLLLPDRTAWKEACGFIHGLELGTALVLVDPADPIVYEISVDDQGRIVSARALDAMAPSSGCSITSAHDLLQAVSASDVVMGIGCVDDQAAMTTGSILTQDGGADGAIWTAQLRSADTWTITDVGTGIDTTLSFPILPAAMWPTSTTGRSSSYWAEPIEAIPSQTTVDAFADELLAALGPLSPDPEFPMNERLVEVRPGGLPLVIVQVDVGGDDSVVGAVFYVWLDEIFDEAGPTGWRAGEVLVGDVCGRGDSSGDICP